jgi:hypothetical protein
MTGFFLKKCVFKFLTSNRADIINHSPSLIAY